MRKPYLVRPAEPRLTKKKDRMGICTHCGRDATKDALFRDGNVTIIEKYYDSCLQAENFTAIMTFYSTNEN